MKFTPRRRLILGLIVILSVAVISGAKAISDTDYNVRTLTNFECYFPQGMSILFQIDDIDYDHVALNPLVGDLNGSSASIWMSQKYGGAFSFIAQENCVLQLTESLGAVKVNTVPYGSGSTIGITLGETYTFEWGYTLAPMLPFSLILGIIGLCMVFGGPIYTVHEVREHEWKTMITGIIITLVGAALVIGWFW